MAEYFESLFMTNGSWVIHWSESILSLSSSYCVTSRLSMSAKSRDSDSWVEFGSWEVSDISDKPVEIGRVDSFCVQFLVMHKSCIMMTHTKWVISDESSIKASSWLNCIPVKNEKTGNPTQGHNLNIKFKRSRRANRTSADILGHPRTSFAKVRIQGKRLYNSDQGILIIGHFWPLYR